MDTMGRGECAKLASSVWLMLRTEHSRIQKKVLDDLNVAREIMNQLGKVSFAQETAPWTAHNQYTKEESQLQLPKMMVGDQWLGNNAGFETTSPVVDRVQDLIGGTCTIFQRMNEQGDMLRVCTNVKKLDGQRAIGTYIPAVNPDGKPNPVIETVLKGETFNGRAYVVNAWYITAYEPIFDAENKVVGVLYVGVKQEEFQCLRNGIMDIPVGKTGYVYILGGSGDLKGKYIISKDGKRDGEYIYDAKDANGNLFVQSIINSAKATKNGQCSFERYPWKNPGDDKARWKISAVTYFEPWDWVIGAGAYEDDYQDAVGRINASLDSLIIYTLIATIITVMVSIVFSTFVAGRLSSPVNNAIAMLKDIAEGEGDLTRRLPITSKDEFRDMAHWFNTLMDNIQDLMKKIAETANALNDSANRLDNTASEMTRQTDRMCSSSAGVNSAAEQVTGNVTEMVSSSEQMAGNAKTAAAAIEEMTSSIKEIARNAEQAANVADRAARLAEESNSNITQLGAAADEIGKVIEVIQDIAEQTNLLALNATIEAARAGDAGKGFAVVASEVKELARQTTEATGDISRRVAAIQQSSDNTVNSIGEISSVIKQVNDVSQTIASAVEEQSITTNEIAQNVSQTAGASEHVSANINQTSDAVKSISGSITVLNQDAKKTNQNALDTKNAGNELSGLAKNLNDLVQRFKI